jgi:geranylgeranyl reductase family protein
VTVSDRSNLSNPSTVADVAIVGAGPAGSRAAYVLARAGARVTLFDPSHPREKACGGGVTGRALQLVADAIPASDWPATVVRSARFIDSVRGRSAVVPLDDQDDGDALRVGSRASFDAALLDAAERAGARLERSRVLDVTVERDHVRLETSDGPRCAAFVIGADGANSLVRRRVSQAFRRDQLSIATGYFARGVTSDEIVLELLSDPPGYIWSFPRPDHLAIGVCGQADAGVTVGKLREITASWIARSRIAGDARLDPYSWPIPSLNARDFECLQLAGPRWCLIGDAAGLVDPITREGIYFAIASGQWAADAFIANNPSLYAQRINEEVVPDLASAARLKAGFFRPAFAGLVVRALHQSGAIRAVMADLIAGRQSYAGLKSRLLRTWEWRLAARLLLRI